MQAKQSRRLGSLRQVVITLLSLLNSALVITSAEAGALPDSIIWGNPSCAVDKSEISLKDNLRKNSFNSTAGQEQYQSLLEKHKTQLEKCRKQTFPQTQALWLRLYANDAKPGVLEDVLDRIVNRGYNQVFIEVFYDGRILLPVADNATPWRSVTEEAVKAGEILPSHDIWAEAVRKGKERGLKVHGWAFALNFGYGYGEISDRLSALARNGAGETSIAKSRFDPKSKLVANGQAFYLDAYEPDHLFADPYSPQAKADYAKAIAALVKRQPDGMLFDYVRYPTSFGKNTLINNIKELWIYGQSSRKALLDRIPDPNIQQLMSGYLDSGKVSLEAISALEIDSVPATTKLANRAQVSERLLWQVAVEHAYRGVLIFVDDAIATVRQNSLNNMSVGAVFFPEGNRKENNSYDARMQPWDRFPINMQRHPMTYAICADGKCVANEVVRVLRASSPQTLVCPVLSGTWGQSFGGHPSLEIQMQAIRAAAPQVKCLSHFVYSWLSDRQRKAGIVKGL